MATILPFPARAEPDTPDPELQISADLIAALAQRIAAEGSQSLALQALEQARERVA